MTTSELPRNVSTFNFRFDYAEEQVKGFNKKMEGNHQQLNEKIEGIQQQLQENQKHILDIMDFKKEHEERLFKMEMKIKELENRLRKEEVNMKSEMDRSEYIIRLQNIEERKKEDLFQFNKQSIGRFYGNGGNGSS